MLVYNLYKLTILIVNFLYNFLHANLFKFAVIFIINLFIKLNNRLNY